MFFSEEVLSKRCLQIACRASFHLSWWSPSISLPCLPDHMVFFHRQFHVSDHQRSFRMLFLNTGHLLLTHITAKSLGSDYPDQKTIIEPEQPPCWSMSLREGMRMICGISASCIRSIACSFQISRFHVLLIMIHGSQGICFSQAFRELTIYSGFHPSADVRISGSVFIVHSLFNRSISVRKMGIPGRIEMHKIRDEDQRRPASFAKSWACNFYTNRHHGYYDCSCGSIGVR